MSTRAVLAVLQFPGYIKALSPTVFNGEPQTIYRSELGLQNLKDQTTDKHYRKLTDLIYFTYVIENFCFLKRYQAFAGPLFFKLIINIRK